MYIATYVVLSAGKESKTLDRDHGAVLCVIMRNLLTGVSRAHIKVAERLVSD